MTDPLDPEFLQRHLEDVLSSVRPSAPNIDAVRTSAGVRARRARFAYVAAASVLVVSGVGVALNLHGSSPRDRVTTTATQPDETPVASASPSVLPTPISTSGAGEPAVTVESGTGPRVRIRQVGNAVTGGPTTFELSILDSQGGLAGYEFSFGLNDPAHPQDEFSGNSDFEGGTVVYGGGDIHESGYSCTGSPLKVQGKTTDKTVRFTHTFRKPGHYFAWARAQTRSCDDVSTRYGGIVVMRGASNTVATLPYDVTGIDWPNGPIAPTAAISFTRSHFEPSPPRQIDTGAGPQFNGGDEDGAVTSMTVDWGDGHQQSLDLTYEDRSNGTSGGCSSYAEFGSTRTDAVARPDHTYLVAGTYRVTLTVTSASCDGSSQQTASTTAQYVWPPPSPSPSAAPKGAVTP